MNIKRLQLLIKRQWLENKKFYAIVIASLGALTAFMFLLTYHWRASFNGDTRKGIFFLFLFVAGGLITSSLFKDLGDKSKGIWLLMLPASSIEKMTNAIIYSLVFFPAVYISVFYLIEVIFIKLVNDEHNMFSYTQILKNSTDIFLSYLNFQIFILLGSIYFEKSSFLKTIVGVIVIFTLVSTANTYILKVITGIESINSSVAFEYFQFPHQGENVYVYLPRRADVITSFALHFLMPLVLLYIAFVRLKEKEL